MDVADEMKEFVESKIEQLKNEAKKEERESIKCHFDYCMNHSGWDSKTTWLRNELFGKA